MTIPGDILNLLASGFGAVLAAALVLAPGGLIVPHLRQSGLLQPYHGVAWSAWASALIELGNGWRLT